VQGRYSDTAQVIPYLLERAFVLKTPFEYRGTSMTIKVKGLSLQV